MLSLILLISVLPAPQDPPETPKSADELIRVLTYQDGRPLGLIHAGMFTCGSSRMAEEEARALVRSIVALGPDAFHALEAAISDIEGHDSQSPFPVNEGYLLEAYAQVRGVAAAPRLQRMLRNPRLDYLDGHIKQAIAEAMGLTRYVTESGRLLRTFSCNGLLDPTIFLNQLILAWAKNDREWVERSLGPRAKESLAKLLGNRPWGDLCSEIWRGRQRSTWAIGYRFESKGWWSAPVNPDEAKTEESPEIKTIFTYSSGVECASHTLRFAGTKTKDFVASRTFLVDSEDMESLLRTIASCAEH